METTSPIVLNVDCAYEQDPGYAYERQRIEAARAVLQLVRATTEDQIIAASAQANILLLEYGNTPITARVLENLPRC